MINKPIIGVTSHYEKTKSKFSLEKAYVDAIDKSGGVPIIIPLYRNASKFLNLIDDWL